MATHRSRWQMAMLMSSMLVPQIEEAMLTWEALLFSNVMRGPGGEPEVMMHWRSQDGVTRCVQVSISEPVPGREIGISLEFIGSAWWEWEHAERRRWKVEELDEIWLTGGTATGPSPSGELRIDSESLDDALRRAQQTVSTWTVDDLGQHGRPPPRALINVLPPLLLPRAGATAAENDQ